jgi:hypothetical protein
LGEHDVLAVDDVVEGVLEWLGVGSLSFVVDFDADPEDFAPADRLVFDVSPERLEVQVAIAEGPGAVTVRG